MRFQPPALHVQIYIFAASASATMVVGFSTFKASFNPIDDADEAIITNILYNFKKKQIHTFYLESKPECPSCSTYHKPVNQQVDSRGLGVRRYQNPNLQQQIRQAMQTSSGKLEWSRQHLP